MDGTDPPIIVRVYGARSREAARDAATREAPRFIAHGYDATSERWTHSGSPMAQAAVIFSVLTIMAVALPVWWASGLRSQDPPNDAGFIVLPSCLIPAAIFGIISLILAARRHAGPLEVTWTRVNDAPAPR